MMMRLVLSILLLSGFIGCTDASDENPDWKWEDQETEQPEVETKDVWADVTSEYSGLKEGIRIMKATELMDKPAVAYVAVADMSKVDFGVWGINDPKLEGTDESFKRPSAINSQVDAQVVINGGFFFSSEGKNYSSSLAVSEGTVLSVNINYASEDWVKMYYPTRAAFIEDAEGKFDACWTYYRTGGNHYMYSIPAENSWEKSPQKTPSAIYPEKAKDFAAVNAIGGGPVLINRGKVVDTYVEELFNGSGGIGPDTNQPRTAVGAMEDGRLVFFVCEGRQMTEGVYGLTTGEVAQVLADLGCTEAINLDGGGSSCMLVGGKATIKVSDGSQRAVASAIYIK